MELTIHAEEPEKLGNAALGWLTDGVREYGRRETIDALPKNVKVSAKGFSRVVQSIPKKNPKGIWGYFHVSPQGNFDVLYNPYTPAAVPWLDQHLTERPESAGVTIGRFSGNGEVGNSDITFTVVFEEGLPDQVKLGFHLDTAALVAPGTTVAEHERLLAVVRWACNRYNVVFGHVSYRRSGGATELESRLRGRPSDPVSNALQWRTLLRGYSWLMVVPVGIAEPLDGREGLTDTGAFSALSSLPNGSLLLQATPTFQQYDNEAVRAVHRAVREVLVQGDLRSPSPVPDQPPMNLVVLDD
ncbi:hypothetical protein ACFU9Y_01070 [Streptomyces sp. NPDC057621]|uniref:hypothetical protein n=1 Tax=Streptomyces sp. NPDC057621 TaxID=3346186 RepID=UPI003678B925